MSVARPSLMNGRTSPRTFHPLYALVLALLLIVGSLSAATMAGKDIVTAARQQIGVTVLYDTAYVRLAYPNGDMVADRGACTDVVVRALRVAGWGDLQRKVHEDMAAHFRQYPQSWRLRSPDANIDYRRAPNLQAYFSRHASRLKVSSRPGDYRPGDLVTSMLPGNLPHIMVVSDRCNAQDVPRVVHNIGRGTREEDVLFAYPLTGHYRLVPD